MNYSAYLAPALGALAGGTYGYLSGDVNDNLLTRSIAHGILGGVAGKVGKSVYEAYNAPGASKDLKRAVHYGLLGAPIGAGAGYLMADKRESAAKSALIGALVGGAGGGALGWNIGDAKKIVKKDDDKKTIDRSSYSDPITEDKARRMEQGMAARGVKETDPSRVLYGNMRYASPEPRQGPTSVPKSLKRFWSHATDYKQMYNDAVDSLEPGGFWDNIGTFYGTVLPHKFGRWADENVFTKDVYLKDPNFLKAYLRSLNDQSFDLNSLSELTLDQIENMDLGNDPKKILERIIDHLRKQKKAQ